MPLTPCTDEARLKYGNHVGVRPPKRRELRDVLEHPVERRIRRGTVVRVVEAGQHFQTCSPERRKRGRELIGQSAVDVLVAVVVDEGLAVNERVPLAAQAGHGAEVAQVEELENAALWVEHAGALGIRRWVGPLAEEFRVQHLDHRRLWAHRGAHSRRISVRLLRSVDDASPFVPVGIEIDVPRRSIAVAGNGILAVCIGIATANSHHGHRHWHRCRYRHRCPPCHLHALRLRRFPRRHRGSRRRRPTGPTTATAATCSAVPTSARRVVRLAGASRAEHGQYQRRLDDRPWETHAHWAQGSSSPGRFWRTPSRVAPNRGLLVSPTVFFWIRPEIFEASTPAGLRANPKQRRY